MSAGPIIGGVVGLLAGGAMVIYGFARNPGITVTNQDGQSAPVSGDGAKWILIILGLVIGIGGIVTLVKGAGS